MYFRGLCYIIQNNTVLGDEFMSADNRLSSGKKFAGVILGALLCGFLWRVRGTHGFGSAWGLALVFACMTLLIFSFYGNRAKIKYELLPIGCISAFIATPAWGIVNGLAGGVLRGSLAGADGEELETVINGYHGLILLIMTGFALVCLYGIFVGTLFSPKEYKLYHYLIYAAVFLAAVYAAKLTFAHNLVKIIIPEAVREFSKGIADAGKDGGVRQVYLHYLFNAAGLKKIAYGRAYGESVEHIAFAFGALALILTSLVAFRDKITAFISFIINLFAAVGITVSNVFLINSSHNPGNIIGSLRLPGFLSRTSWGMWEFFTGFFIGLGIMLVIALIPDKYTAGKHYKSESAISNKIVRFVYNYLFTFGFALAAVPVRAAGLRLADTLEGAGVISSERNELVSYIIIGVLGAAAAVLLFALLKKNILDKNLPVPVRKKPLDFARLVLPGYTLLILILFLIPDAEMLSLISSAKAPAEFLQGLDRANIAAVISAVLFLAAFVTVKKRSVSNRRSVKR